MQRTILFVSLVALIAGCEDKKKDAPPPPASAAAAAMPSASPSASASSNVAPSGHMAHCPTAVSGATTSIKDVEGGVELTITAKEDAAAGEIRGRMKALIDAAKTENPAKEHTGTGGGKGLFGHCTIVMHDTVLDATDVPGGLKVVVKPKNAKELDWVRRETRDRDANAKAPGGEGMGTNRMQHCPSAASGATTQVINTKDGVIVLVTGKGDAIQEIRNRAKHTVMASKTPDGKVDHKGDGHGGGGLGRCPVVVQDAIVEAKDVEGGSQISVKAEKPAGVASLQKEAKDRAANFAAAPTPAK